VVCEGEVSEPLYIRGFVRKTRNATVEVRIHGERGEPRKLVEMAKSEKQHAIVRAQRQDDDFLAHDEVWCAFDRDQHERFEDACQMARDNQLELAVSNPCFSARRNPWPKTSRPGCATGASRDRWWPGDCNFIMHELDHSHSPGGSRRSTHTHRRS
jgi:hypothetical protein